ncbi:cell division FtsA domain-containing protein [Patescibacteria group bacterium]
MSLFLLFALPRVRSLRTIAQSLGFEIISIIVEPYAITRAFEGAAKEDFNAVFVDVGGGTTDVAVVSKGGIMGTKMMAIGGKVFTKRLEKKFDLSFNEAEKLKIEYSEREVSEGRKEEIRKIFNQDASVWVDGISLALEEFEDIDIYPSKFLLCGGGSLLGELKKAIVEYPWLQTLKFEKFPDVDFINPTNLKGLVDEKKLLKNVSDIAPAALAYMALELNVQ